MPKSANLTLAIEGSVRVMAPHGADSFFAALDARDEGYQVKPKKKPPKPDAA